MPLGPMTPVDALVLDRTEPWAGAIVLEIYQAANFGYLSWKVGCPLISIIAL
jgi:hypothetical protein